MDTSNPLGLRGISFVEFASPEPLLLHRLFSNLGFSHTQKHRRLNISHYAQKDIHLLVNEEPNTHADRFCADHGPCISAMGWRVDNAAAALQEAVRRGAKAFVPTRGMRGSLDVPALMGIGDSVIYLVDKDVVAAEFTAADRPHVVPPVGFTRIDHLTNNVHQGTLPQWADFYKNVFGFTEVRSFDIRGTSTGLYSFALRSPCGTFCIPINEGTEGKSQIEEYLREYSGPGVQHLAFLTEDLLGSLDHLQGRVPTLDMDAEYYRDVFARVPRVTEDHQRIQKHQALVDGDEQGYLLQIFTQNLVGPIFFEFIQRKNHQSFGEGNFSALFRSIERDQERRGVL